MIRDNIMSQIDLPTDFDFQQAGRQVLEIEREGLAQLDQYINEDFTHACETIFRCGGKVVVMGMGKSGQHRPQNGGNLRQYRHLGIFCPPRRSGAR